MNRILGAVIMTLLVFLIELILPVELAGGCDAVVPHEGAVWQLLV